jgi:type III secretion protein R
MEIIRNSFCQFNKLKFFYLSLFLIIGQQFFALSFLQAQNTTTFPNVIQVGESQNGKIQSSPVDLDTLKKVEEALNEPKMNERPSVVTQAAVISLLSLLPYLVILLTAFIKITIVLSLLRNALGVQQSPPSQVINGLALILSIYVMFPTGMQMYNAGKSVIHSNMPKELVSPETSQYILDVIEVTKEPLKGFLIRNTDASHLKSFYKLAYKIFPEEEKASLTQTDFLIVVPAYITTQLKDAYEIGVLIYLPFFVIDLVVSNILLAMGMMMLSPLTIALPLKLLLIVMIDGWTVLIQGLVLTFR